MIPVVDTHQHLWNLEQFDLPWLDDEKDGVLRRNFLMSDYLEASHETGVTQSIYMEVDVEPSQREAEAEFVIGLARRDDNPLAGAVIGGCPEAEGFAEYAARFGDIPEVKGFRDVIFLPRTEKGHCLKPEFVSGVRALANLGKSFDLCMRPSELADAVELADRCPDTLFIVDHCGNADPMIVNGSASGDREGLLFHDAEQWRRDMGALGARKNVVCKISGIVARAPAGWAAETLAPTVEHCLESFGSDRAVFGGDWPVCTYGAPLGEWIKALREIVSSRPEAEQAMLFHVNAERLYKLV